MEFYTVFVLDNTKRTIHDEMIFKSVMTFPISKAKNLALLFLLLVPLLIKAALMPFMSLIYDEVAYSWTANRLVMHGGWIDIYGVRDLFFWPPLFNYLAAFPIAFGADRLYAVRIITLIISSLIPPLFYLLILHSGYGLRAAWLTALLWIVNPWVMRYSVVGHPDVPMLTFVLLALLLLQQARNDRYVSKAIISAAALAASIWIKETAIGLVPLFLAFLWCKPRLLVAWSLTFVVLIIPLLAPSFLDSPYGIFLELTGRPFRWGDINLYSVIQNIIKIQGLEQITKGPVRFIVSLVVLITMLLSIISTWTEIRRGRFLLCFCAASLLIFITFFTFFWKKFTYYAITPYAFLVPFIGVYLARFHRWALVYLVLLFILSVPAIIRFSDRREEVAILNALKAVEKEKKSASVAMPTPRIAEYLVEHTNIAVRISPDDWVACSNKSKNCMLDHDYLLGNDRQIMNILMFFFCGKSFPLASCNYEAINSILNPERLVGTWGNLRLYRLYDKKILK